MKVVLHFADDVIKFGNVYVLGSVKSESHSLFSPLGLFFVCVLILHSKRENNYEAQLQISISSSIVYVLLTMFSNLIVTFEPFVLISIFSPVYEPGTNTQSLYN